METTVTHRICNICEIEKPLSELHTTTSGNKIYYRPVCKICWLDRRKFLRRQPKKIPIYLRETRICKDCLIEQPVENFMLRYDKKHRQARCRPCHNAYKKKMRLQQPVEHRSQIERASRIKYAAKNKEKIAEKNRQWVKNNPDKRNAKEQRRRQRIKQAVGNIDREFVIQRDGNICYLCKAVLNETEVTIDHVIPIINGGNNLPENLRVCCKTCNHHKSINLISDLHNFPYFQKLGFVK